MQVMTLSDARALDVAMAGGKGASLARLAAAGFSVPEAIIVTAGGAAPDGAAAAEIKSFLSRHPKASFAVRSSALDEDGVNDSFAGQHETFLNVKEDGVMQAIRDCRQSFFSARAQAYRAQKDLGAASAGAVVVQRMIAPDFAGVAFSLDPGNGQNEFIVIEYVEGLGDKLVGGEVTPKKVTVRKSTLALSGDVAAGQAGLFRELAVQVMRCAEAWDAPVDVEFAFERGHVWLLQCRPITAFIDDPRPVFELSYTRSMTIMQQAAWHKVFKLSPEKFFGWQCSFEYPATFFYLNNNSVEIWENARMLDWLIEKVQAQNLADPAFFDRVFAAFGTQYAQILAIAARGGVATLAELRSLVELTDIFALNFAFIYFSSINEATPEPVRSKAVDWRRHDESWAKLSDALVPSIARAMPQAAGCEIAVVPEDLEAPPDAKTLRQRMAHFVYIPHAYQAVEELFDSRHIMDHFRLVFPKADPALLLNNQLAGEPVFGGKLTGRVRIIRHRNDIAAFKEGEILVSPMTTPDFLPAMTRAAAILTDEGGTLCHAAIVARELKIPCIVGLKAISALVRNGDAVEIDAERGVVSICR